MKRNILQGYRGLLFLVCMIAGMINMNYSVYAATRNLDVEKHTPDEIREYIDTHTGASECGITYATEPIVTSPYSPGALSQATLQCALDALNEIRYIAGIYDGVILNDTYNSQCQAGSLVNYVNATLSHYPQQPSDMGDELYELGLSGTSSSNIAWHSWNSVSLKSVVINSWMADDDYGNIDRVGHRRWCLNPSMGQVGFGAVGGENGTYSAMYSFDRSYSASNTSTVVWPAQNMPTDYFEANYPWSISSDTAFASDVLVVLTRVEDGVQWEFSSTAADGYFNYNADGYGQYHCLIFRPTDIGAYYDGEQYKVEVIENGEVTLDYMVSFFDLEPISEDVTLSITSDSGTIHTISDSMYTWVANVLISDTSISGEELSVVSSDETVAQARIATYGEGSGGLFIKARKYGVAKITVYLTKDLFVEYTVTVSEDSNGTGDSEDGGEIHAHNYIDSNVVNATCITKGKRTKTCTVCGYITTEEIPKEKHVSSIWIIDKAPTYETVGSRYKECKVCHCILSSETIPVLKLQQGDVVTVTGGKYKVCKSTQGNAVQYVGPSDKLMETISIPGSITVGTTTYKVTQIAAKAFSGNKSLKSVTIPASVQKIGAKAFYNCKNLKKITIKTKKLKTSTVGSKAFSGIHKKAKVKVSKSKVSTYKKMLKKKGLPAKATVKK